LKLGDSALAVTATIAQAVVVPRSPATLVLVVTERHRHLMHLVLYSTLAVQAFVHPKAVQMAAAVC